jgi:hypothetical protein
MANSIEILLLPSYIFSIFYNKCMGLEISQGAVFYIVIMLVVIYIGISYVTGGNFLGILTGEGPVEPTLRIQNNITCSANDPVNCNMAPQSDGYTVTITMSIDYNDNAKKDITIYPILDFGNNPVFGDKEIPCTYSKDNKQYNCPSKQDYTYTLNANKMQSVKDFGKGFVLLQIYFFKKTEAIKSYINDVPQGSSGRTMSNMLKTFSDFYIYNKGIGIEDTSGSSGSTLDTYCKDKSEEQCKNDEYCYIEGNQCKACKITDDCGRYLESECMKCKYAKDLNCAWKPTTIAYTTFYGCVKG